MNSSAKGATKSTSITGQQLLRSVKKLILIEYRQRISATSVKMVKCNARVTNESLNAQERLLSDQTTHVGEMSP